MGEVIAKPKHRCSFCGENTDKHFMVCTDTKNPFKPAICDTCVENAVRCLANFKELYERATKK